MNRFVDGNEGQETCEVPIKNVHGTVSSKQPSTKTSVILPEMFSVTLFELAEFLDAKFVAILTKVNKILKNFFEALKISSFYQIRGLGPCFTNYLDKLHTSYGKLFLDDKMVMPPHLRSPIMMRLHKGHSGIWKT